MAATPEVHKNGWSRVKFSFVCLDQEELSALRLEAEL